MNAETPPAAARRWQPPRPSSPAADIAWLAGAPIVAITAAAAAALPLWPTALLAIVATSALLAAHRQQLGNGPFGIANGVTLLRLNLTIVILVASIAALATGDIGQHQTWATFATALTALVLDGLDGWLARRRHEASPFGERFDMAADTAFTITLTIALLAFNLTGAWVLTIGLLRPLFQLLGRLRPSLRAPLPPWRLRKMLCALALCLLTATLAPPLASVAPPLAAAALATLLYSFSRDTWHLERPPTSAAEDEATGER